MLEHRVLLLHARKPATKQLIVDADSGAVLGFVRWEQERTRSWRQLFSRRVLAVHEQDDEPLLFTVSRAWSLLPRLEVKDAEGELIGNVLGRFLRDRYGRPIAILEEDAFHDPYRRRLAELIASPAGLRLRYSEDIDGEPFVKMLLLAVALTR